MAPRIKTGMDLLIVIMLQIVSFGLLVGWNNPPSNAAVPATATAKTDELEEVNMNGLSLDVLAGHGDLIGSDKPQLNRVRPPDVPQPTNDVRPVGFATNRGAQPIPPAKIY